MKINGSLMNIVLAVFLGLSSCSVEQNRFPVQERSQETERAEGKRKLEAERAVQEAYELGLGHGKASYAPERIIVSDGDLIIIYQNREAQICQEPPVKDWWHEDATLVLEHCQNSTSDSNHSSQTSGILKFKKSLRGNYWEPSIRFRVRGDKFIPAQ